MPQFYGIRAIKPHFLAQIRLHKVHKEIVGTECKNQKQRSYLHT